MKKKRPLLKLPNSISNPSDNAKESGWGLIKELKENKKKSVKHSEVDIKSFGSIKKLTSYEIIKIIGSGVTAASTDDGDMCACACNCYGNCNCNCGDA